MRNFDLENDEDFRADCREAALPDAAFVDLVKCKACGATGAKEDAYRWEGAWLCPDCAEATGHIEEMCK